MSECEQNAALTERYSGSDISHVYVEPAGVKWANAIEIAFKNGKHIRVSAQLNSCSVSIVARLSLQRGCWGQLGRDARRR